jgi:hypothetical protein
MSCSQHGRRWSSLLFIVVLVVCLVCAASAQASEPPVWRFAPALAPPPPPEVPPAPYPVPVGQVGQISFWAPNHGLLIDSGGLYAYDGVDWHQLATVCGGAEGRIAWAGPDDFWTISDQRGGQQLPPDLRVQLQSISLCHFLDGQVVGSYAMPLEQPDSWLHMDAAACYNPSDCWFGGNVGASPNTGAFHLHWDGASVSAVYAPEDYAVTGIVNFEGELYESVDIGQSPPTNPPVIHTIAPAGSSPTFTNLYLYPPSSSRTLPEYQHKAPPFELEGFTLASDGPPLEAGATQLWAAANAQPNSTTESLTVLHCVKAACASGEWSQVAPKGETTLEGTRIESTPAPEPGSESAWLSLRNGSGNAVVGRLDSAGALAEVQTLPRRQESSEVGYRGTAGPITCPAPHDCWMATEEGTNPATGGRTTPGWLFHLTDGSQYPQDADPNFAGVITYRPPDAGVPLIYPDLPPADDSLANQIVIAPPSNPPEQAPTSPAKRAKAKSLLTHVKSRLEHGRVLIISFVLTARAHVQIVGRRGKRVVAKTREESLHAGAHELSLSLDPANWPTKLQFEARPGGASASASVAVHASDTFGT